MWHKVGDLEKFVEGLVAVDVQLAEQERQKGCRCGGRLHRADYPRKLRGIPELWESKFRRRLSFCCAERECRRRRTPPSVRFFGQKVYASVLILACCAEWVKPQEVEVPRRTVRRWSQFFRRKLVDSLFWRSARARLMPQVVESRLPGSLLERFPGDEVTKLSYALKFLAPLTTRSAGSLMDG